MLLVTYNTYIADRYVNGEISSLDLKLMNFTHNYTLSLLNSCSTLQAVCRLCSTNEVYLPYLNSKREVCDPCYEEFLKLGMYM